jgi:hypothetical protein
MKRAIWACILALACLHSLHAQNVFPSSGNVGIGTNSPLWPLHVVTTGGGSIGSFQNTTTANSWISVQNTTTWMNLGIGSALPHPYIYSNSGNLFIGADGGSPTFFVNGMVNGNIGIGTITPGARLHLVASNAGQMAFFQNTSSNNTCISVGNSATSMNLGVGSTLAHPYIWSGSGSFYIGGDAINSPPTFFVNGMVNGSVGIGTLNTGTNKLAVEGTIASRKVIVTQAVPFPDYVFDTDYRLPSLNSLADYVKAYHHLPEVPTADSVARAGLDLGGNQVALLKKIEELTLYAIDANKMILEQSQKLEALQKEVQLLKKGKMH